VDVLELNIFKKARLWARVGGKIAPVLKRVRKGVGFYSLRQKNWQQKKPKLRNPRIDVAASQKKKRGEVSDYRGGGV